MRLLRFGGWIITFLTAMVIVGSGLHSAFTFMMPTLGVDGNHAQAGGYTMELIVGCITFTLVLWRLLWALETVNTLQEAWTLLKTRTAVLSVGLSGLVFMVASNRFYWWQKHMFTDEAFNSTGSYTGAANSALVSFVMCVLVYSLHARPDNLDDQIQVYHKTRFPLGLPTAVGIWASGWVAFVAGAALYVNQY